MGRLLSPFLTSFFADRAAADNRVYNTEFALDITLRTGGNLRLGTKDLTLSTWTYRGASVAFAPAQTYTGKLSAVPEIFYSQDSTADGSGVFDAINLDYLLSAIIPEVPRVLDRAEIIGYICYPKDDGSYEGQIFGKGFLRLTEGDDQVAHLSYVSDITDKSVLMGSHELTQRCLNVFQVIDPLRRSWCGAANDTNIPGGSTCSLVFDDVDNGCIFWGQEATFQGVSFFNPNAVPGYGGPLGGGDINPGGGGGGQGGCCDEAGWWLFSDGLWRGGENVKEGVALLDQRGRIGLVTHVERLWAEYRYLVTASGGAQVICSVDHPLITSLEDETGTPALELYGKSKKDLNQRVIEYGTRPTLSRYKLEPAPSGWVLKISLSGSRRLYIAGTKPGSGIVGHNKISPYDWPTG